MAIKIRLKLTGKKNARSFRIVAVDESAKRDGKVVEELGIILPKTKPVTMKFNQERISYWLKQGAQITSGVSKYYKTA